MIKFHYGPWDERYYQLLPYLEARQLISISQDKNTYYLRLTEKGVNATKIFSDYDEFSNLIQDMKVVKSVLGSYSGTKLKNLIYKIFGDEVAIKKLKESINYE